MIIEGCKPDTDPRDRRILFGLTGRRMRQSDFPVEDETTQEEDESVLLENILGFDDIDSDKVLSMPYIGREGRESLNKSTIDPSSSVLLSPKR